MAIIKLEESRRSARGVVPAASTGVEAPSAPGLRVDFHDPVAGTGVAVVQGEDHRTGDQVLVDELRNELDDYFVGLRTLNAKTPDEVFRWLSSVSARLCEIRAKLWRSESRRLAALRSREVDPLIEEVDRQFRFHSRLQASMELEWNMAKGQG